MNMYIACVCYFIFIGDTVITPCVVYMYFSLQSGQTALMIASFKNCVECVRLLLEKGADFNLRDNVRAVSQSIIVCLTCSSL